MLFFSLLQPPTGQLNKSRSALLAWSLLARENRLAQGRFCDPSCQSTAPRSSCRVDQFQSKKNLSLRGPTLLRTMTFELIISFRESRRTVWRMNDLVHMIDSSTIQNDRSLPVALQQRFADVRASCLDMTAHWTPAVSHPEHWDVLDSCLQLQFRRSLWCGCFTG